ncbi:MAG: hypothetical protein KTR33_10635 [Gammaproteobacteria bacterium]|nr:hypothetical protein [Gammaproteobacteria bacterium]
MPRNSIVRVSSRILERACISALCFVLVACGSGQSDGTLNLNADPSNLNLDSPDTVLLEDELSDNEQPQLSYHDCQQKLPCEWTSPDTGITVVFESVISDVFADSLVTSYEIHTTRDTSVSLVGSASLVDSDGRRYTAHSPELNTTSAAYEAGNTIRVLAGIGIGVKQAFRSVPEFTTRFIARYLMEIAEAGVVHRVGFKNLPLDSSTGLGTNCRLQLPCTWNDAEDEYSVTVLLVDGMQEGRLAIHFSVDVFANSLVSLAQGSIAKGNDGTIFTPKIQTLGDQSDYLKVEVRAVSGATLMGSQTYFRTAQHLSTSLKQLELRIDLENTAEVVFPVFNDLPLN